MDIKYNVRSSKFLAPCLTAIKQNRALLDNGDTVEVRFEEQEDGMAECVRVEIRAADPEWFGTDWEKAVETLFPARIKAAATALRDCECFGLYFVEHSEGLLTIRVA